MSAAAPKSALVTGGSKRVGRAICEALANAGWNVAIHYNSSRQDAETLAHELARKGKAKTAIVAGDLTDPSLAKSIIKDASQQIGKLSLLVNNASLFEADEFGTITDQSWDHHLAANLASPIRLAQAFAAQAESGASIINIIDQRVWALTPKFFSYTIAKSALWTATQTMAQSLAPRGIRVNAIGPGPTLRNSRQSEADWQRQNTTMPLGKGAEPGDICTALLYLVSATAVTGQMIAVDGGQHLAWETPDVLVKE